MVFLLDQNIARQTRLKNATSKEIYIPYNAGRGTGVSFTPDNTNVKLTEWITGRIADTSIVLDVDAVRAATPYYEYIVRIAADSSGVITQNQVMYNTFPSNVTFTWDVPSAGMYRLRSNIITNWPDYTNLTTDFWNQVGNRMPSWGGAIDQSTAGRYQTTKTFINNTHSVGFENYNWVSGTTFALGAGEFGPIYFILRKFK